MPHVDYQQIRKLSHDLSVSIDYADLMMARGRYSDCSQAIYGDIPNIIESLTNCVTDAPDE